MMLECIIAYYFTFTLRLHTGPPKAWATTRIDVPGVGTPDVPTLRLCQGAQA